MQLEERDAKLSAFAAQNAAARTLDEAVSEVNREVAVRERCFPRWIQEKRLDSIEAKDRLERLKSAANYLEDLLDRVLQHCNALPATATAQPS
jgi:hypothetical protein